jgi:phage gp29-like protein
MDRSAKDTDRAAFLAALSSMIRDAVAVFPNDASVEIKEASNVSGNSDAFEKYARYHDGQISTVLLGHSSAVDATPGKLGNDATALEARKDIVDNDCEMASETINTLIKWVHELNPSLGAERPVFKMYKETDVDTDRADRDQKLMTTGQVRLTKKYFTKRYDYEDEDIEVVEPPAATAAAPGPQFSAPPGDTQKQIDDLVNGLPDSLLQTQIEEVLKPVIALIEKAANFAEVHDGVAKLFPKLNTADIQTTIEKATLLSEIWGRLNG